MMVAKVNQFENKLLTLLQSCPLELQKIAILYVASNIRKKAIENRLPDALIAYHTACWASFAGEEFDISKWTHLVELSGSHGMGLAYEIDAPGYPSQEYGVSVSILNACMLYTKLLVGQHDTLTSVISTMSMDFFVETLQQTIDCAVLTEKEVYDWLADLNITQKSVIDIWA